LRRPGQEQIELDLRSQHSDAYRNFINSIDSEVTRADYKRNISYSIKFCQKADYEEILQLAKEDINKLEGIVRDYIIYLRQEKRLSSASVSVYVAATIHFYGMNDVRINWKKLKKFKAKHRTVVEDKPFTRQQIKQLIEYATLRDKGIVLMMASARGKHVQKII
jgi:hypothetical protein